MIGGAEFSFGGNHARSFVGITHHDGRWPKLPDERIGPISNTTTEQLVPIALIEIYLPLVASSRKEQGSEKLCLRKG